MSSTVSPSCRNFSRTIGRTYPRIAKMRPVRVKLGTLSVPMWHELQLMPVCLANEGIAWDSVGINSRIPARLIAAAQSLFHQARIMVFLLTLSILVFGPRVALGVDYFCSSFLMYATSASTSGMTSTPNDGMFGYVSL